MPDADQTQPKPPQGDTEAKRNPYDVVQERTDALRVDAEKRDAKAAADAAEVQRKLDEAAAAPAEPAPAAPEPQGEGEQQPSETAEQVEVPDGPPPEAGDDTPAVDNPEA